ncbi:hypothetical protein FSARC_7148 [Fusarium sarcochroum]|uniref:Lytic polysaccharide monooxygenase n=1 Tax=Fusarium sarcochroum TaxID=1208366 RepID=A0A8H4X8A6_9HYPO|nr:hypothetical protein FSARC_7148 [Fusarium sarcochroum]
MRIYSTTLALWLLGSIRPSESHMEMYSPAPLRSKFNPYTHDIDYSMTSPLLTDGSNFPCKNYQSLLYTPAGTPVATLKGGNSYSVTITGEATHAGGSCQTSLSVDGGMTFRVLHSFIGNCPPNPGYSDFNFRVPIDVPPKDRALLAWTWFNKLGDREMYMNCASVATEPGEGSAEDFVNRPLIFVANVGNDCMTLESTDVLLPNPGFNVDYNSEKAVPPVGNCAVG